MKKCISLILVFAFVIGIFAIVPLAPTVNATSVDDLTFELNDDGASYSVSAKEDVGISGELIIPSEYNGLPVTSIADYAFEDCFALTSVIIPDGITSIGDYAFNACIALTSVIIPNSVKTIGEGAFYYCVVLTSISIPDSVTSIGESAFGYCYDLANVTLGNGITNLSNLIFADCFSLTSITIPDSVTSIDGGAFYECTKLTNITIPDKVTSIGEVAFYYCRNLISITIPDSVTDIHDTAFENCSKELVFIINDNDYVIDYSEKNNFNYILNSNNKDTLVFELNEGGLSYSVAGHNITTETELVIPDTYNGLPVTSIGYNAFFDCSSLTSVTIPDSVTSIGNSAFSKCTSLTSVTIPDSVTSIGGEVFYKCALKYVFYTGSAEEWNKITIGSDNSVLTSLPIHYNATGHGHSVVKSLPFFEGMEGTIEDICPICGYVNRSEKIVWVNDHITAVDTKDVVVDTSSNSLVLDITASKNLNEAIIEMDGYTLTTTPTSDYGYYGTGSKVQVKDTNGTQVAEYTLVVRGDVNGDSVCDVIDCMLLELAKNDHTELAGIYLTAADLTENGDIDVDDFEVVVNKAIA